MLGLACKPAYTWPTTDAVVCALLVVLLGQLGCSVGLREQQSLARMSSAVAAQCVAALGGQKRPVCSRAKACIAAAHEAELDVQAAIETRAKGQPDEDLEVQASASVAGARASCAAVCFGPTGEAIKGCAVARMGSTGGSSAPSGGAR